MQRLPELGKCQLCDLWMRAGAATRMCARTRAISRRGDLETTRTSVTRVDFTRPVEKLTYFMHQARRKWSQYLFFTRRIEDIVAKGGTAIQAVRELDNLRGSRTVPQLHRELQPRKERRVQDTPTTANAVAAVEGVDDRRSAVVSLPLSQEGLTM